MIIFLSVILLLSMFMNIMQFKARKERNTNLQYITKKLYGIVSERTNERLLLVTAEQEIRDLLIGVNRLLAYNHEMTADNAQTKLSMRRMLSNVSHDLKTPLSVVLGYIETVRYNRSLSSEERDVLLSKAQLKTVEVSGLINKFFDLAKLESGDWLIERKRVHLNEVCRKSVLSYYDILERKGIEVSIEIPQAPICISADEQALSRILDNLLSNAIRYGYEGGIVGLTLYQDDSHAYIDVWDKGKGIQEADRDRIFERLYTLEDSRNSSTDGSGLGLTIAKRLTEQLEGFIEVNSSPYGRTVFTLRFAKLREMFLDASQK